MAHAWNACWVQALGGSNPPSSASVLSGLRSKWVSVAQRSKTLRTRADIIRRRRRERQFVVFGLLLIGLGAVSVAALAIYQGRTDSPVDYAFVTPDPDFLTEVNVPCPPQGAGENTALPADQVAVRVQNGTDVSGLAGNTLSVLEGRGYRALAATNWNQSYGESVRIQFGEAGLRHAYTVAANFPEVELVMDNRDSIVVDIILGELYQVTDIRPQYAPELAPERPLVQITQCIPASLVSARPAPAIIPEVPEDLLPAATPSPSPSPGAEGDEA